MTAAAAADPARSNGRLLAWTLLVGTLTLINYTGNLLSDEELPDDLLYRYSSAVFGAIQFAVMLGIVLLIARPGDIARTLALRRPVSWRRAAGLGALLMLAIFIILAALSPFLQPGEEQGLLPDDWDPDRAPQFVANTVVIVLLAPVVEELTYRGLGVTLLERFGRALAILVTGIAFALSHGLVEALPAFIAFGAGLALLRVRSESVYPGIVVHALFNGIALLGAVVA